MLPFLKNTQESGDSASSDPIKRESDGENDMDLLEEAIEEFFNAKSKEARAAAFRAACEIVDSEPHEEGEHIG